MNTSNAVLSKTDLRFELIESEPGFYGLEKSWIALEARTNNRNISSSFLWLKTWWDTFKNRDDAIFGHSKRLRILTAFSGGELLAIFPFLSVRRGPRFARLEYIEFLGQQWGGIMLDVLVAGREQETIQAGLEWINTHFRHHLLHLRYLPEGSPLLASMKMLAHPLSACPIIRIRDYPDFEHYQAFAYSKSLKQNLRTAANKMKADHRDWACRISRIGNEELEEIKRLSAQKLIDGKAALYLDPDKARFIRKITEAMDAEVLFIRIGEANVAYRLNFAYGGQKFCFDASYDRAFPKYELGTLSVQESIKDSYKKNLEIHCEGTGIDSYKRKFTKDAVAVFTVVAKGRGWLSGPVHHRAELKARTAGFIFREEWNKAYG